MNRQNKDYLIEWDEEKAIQNEKKHGILFEEASLVFLDANRIESFDDSHSESEDRFITIGRVRRIITIIYTVRSGDVLRIISARIATKEEEMEYYGYR